MPGDPRGASGIQERDDCRLQLGTGTGLVKDEEEGGARGLQFVRDVGMPLRVIGPVGTSVFAETVVLGIAIDNVELGEALDISRRRCR